MEISFLTGSYQNGKYQQLKNCGKRLMLSGRMFMYDTEISKGSLYTFNLSLHTYYHNVCPNYTKYDFPKFH